ncbi:hypothetical protein PspLS_05382, partial [Pyricularia sp. CBS 133598]
NFRQKKLVRLATATAIRACAHLATCDNLCWCGWMAPVVIGSNRVECRRRRRKKKAHRHRTSSGDGGKLVTHPAHGRLVNFHCLLSVQGTLHSVKRGLISVSAVSGLRVGIPHSGFSPSESSGEKSPEVARNMVGLVLFIRHC